METTLLLDFIQTQPFDCLILPDPSIRKLYSVVDLLRQRLAYPSINVGAKISKLFIQVGMKQRGRSAQDLLEASIFACESEPVLCFGIDLLFEPSLQIDPLMVFRHIARQRKIIVCWPGAFDEQILSYAVPEHNHYRTWRLYSDWQSPPEVKVYLLPNSIA